MVFADVTVAMSGGVPWPVSSSVPWRLRSSFRGRARLRARAGRRQHQPGQFDFYVLALSWSPSFCEDSAERGREAREQCGAAALFVRRARPVAAIRARLPANTARCRRRGSTASIMTSMLDLMPAPRLDLSRVGQARHLLGPFGRRPISIWCARRATAVKIPEAYATPKSTLTVTPGRGRGGVRQGQSRAVARRHRGDLRQHAAERGAHLHEQGFAASATARRSTAAPAGATSW